MNMATADRRLN